MQISLLFQGYTWDQYFQMIADKQGILAVYSGRLDGEGNVKMVSLLSISWEKRFGNIYESEYIKQLRSELSPDLMLFYSYAEIAEAEGVFIAQQLKNKLSNHSEVKKCELEIHCTGACALFPKDIIETT